VKIVWEETDITTTLVVYFPDQPVGFNFIRVDGNAYGPQFWVMAPRSTNSSGIPRYVTEPKTKEKWAEYLNEHKAVN
jgi:hypothetical protein